MKTSFTKIIICFFFCSLYSGFTIAQSFKKKGLYISLSEGVTNATFSTSKNDNKLPSKFNIKKLDGERDPLIIEYGISSKIGIGISMGSDIFKINPQNHYGNTFKECKEAKVKTSEFTLDLNYHLFNTRKTDISAFISLGTFSLNFEGRESDFEYKYTSQGGLVRIGSRAKYYFSKRVGVMAMFSTFSANSSPKDVKETNIAKNYNTNLNGFSSEFGLCFRFF